jgi:hypothetical protein
MACRACIERGKTWDGADPKCAFESGVFSHENWNCATMNTLRDICEKEMESANHYPYNNDQRAWLFPVFGMGEFLVLTWYKSRGKTDGAFVIDEERHTVLTLAEAEVIINQYANNEDSSERPGGNSA